jgi:predicted ATPase
MTDSPAEDGTAVRPVPFISRVRLKNYKSIAECDVSLGPLTILVGPNGSGKSNFLDALAFMGRALATTPQEAVNERGGIGEILRRVPEPADFFGISVDVMVPWGTRDDLLVPVHYGFEIGPPLRRGVRPFEVTEETGDLHWAGRDFRFHVTRGSVRDESLARQPAAIESDRLYLQSAAVQMAFAPAFRYLSNMRFYNFELDVLRQVGPALDGALLDERGGHLGDALGALAAVRPDTKERLDAYLRIVASGIEGIDRFSSGGYSTVVLRARAGTANGEVEFGSHAISDGTIRAAAVLVSLFQLATMDRRISLVAIEEPESALHPAAAGALFDALTEASEHVQVLATSQSADLLDRDDLDPSIIRPVQMRDGLTVIGEVDDASREIAEKKLYTLGELMRGNQLAPKPASPDASTPEEA